MKLQTLRLIALALILCSALAAPASFAAEAPVSSPVDADQTSSAVVTLEDLWQGSGDCELSCNDQSYWYYGVSYSLCCSGTLTCPDSTPGAVLAFYPYQGSVQDCY